MSLLVSDPIRTTSLQCSSYCRKEIKIIETIRRFWPQSLPVTTPPSNNYSKAANQLTIMLCIYQNKRGDATVDTVPECARSFQWKCCFLKLVFGGDIRSTGTRHKRARLFSGVCLYHDFRCRAGPPQNVIHNLASSGNFYPVSLSVLLRRWVK